MAVWMSVVALLAISLGYALVRSAASAGGGERPATEEAAHESTQADEAHESPEIGGLKVEPVTIGESWDVVATTGRIVPNANQSVKVGPRIAGRIVRVEANVGDVVRQGQVLASISSVELAQTRATYRQAQAKVQVARDAYARQARLADLGVFSKRPVEEARAEYLSAQGELADVKSELVRDESELAQCTTRLRRIRELHKDQIVSLQDLEEAEANAKHAAAAVEATRAKVTHAQSQLETAEAYYQREEKVLRGNHLASKEVQAAKAEVTAAQLELRAAGDALRVLGAWPGGSGEVISITSPISGRVVDRATNLGEMVEPSDTLFTVMNLSEVWVEASVYEKDLARVHAGQLAEVRVNSYPGQVFSGRVAHVGDVLEAESRTAKVRCAVANSGGLLKPEMFATVSIITAKRSGAVLVPKEAVIDDAGKKVAFVACMDCEEDKRARKSVCGTYDKVEVKLGPTHGDKAEVIGEIEPGQEVVTAGAYQLKTALGSGKLDAGCADD
jgi:cobalt-zinc-cadmium efflux system membrane fusion protein